MLVRNANPRGPMCFGGLMFSLSGLCCVGVFGMFSVM